jgi:hypothetical protein
MNNDFVESYLIRPDRIRNSTHLGLTIRLSGGVQDFRHINWQKYHLDCRESLHGVARQHGLEILVWSVDFDELYTLVSHQVSVRGVLPGTLPLQLIRALRPCPAYRMLGFFERAVRKDWRVGSALSSAIESENLRRFDRAGKPLTEMVPGQLLMRAITETHWLRLISPADNPWAYINTATQRIFKRHYQNTERGTRNEPLVERDSSESGDELRIADSSELLRAGGFDIDAITVLKAKAQGRTWVDLQSHLTDGAGRPISAEKVRAVSRQFRRLAPTLRPSALTRSTWMPRSSSNSVYKERVPDGELWKGSWTYAHKYQGEELEQLR